MERDNYVAARRPSFRDAVVACDEFERSEPRRPGADRRAPAHGQKAGRSCRSGRGLPESLLRQGRLRDPLQTAAQWQAADPQRSIARRCRRFSDELFRSRELRGRRADRSHL